MNVIPDLWQRLPVDILQGQPAVPDEPPCLFQYSCSQDEAVLRMVFQVPVDPAPSAHFVKRRGIVCHRFRIGYDLIKGVEIFRGVFLQKQAFGFNHSFHS